MSKAHAGGRDVRNTNTTRSSPEPIAIVGIGCRLPGGAQSPDRFWSNLLDGVDAITEVPATRWNKQKFYDPGQGIPGKSQTCRGGFVDNIDQFDPQFFGISPREASRMDPQQRMLLEVAWEAIEDAGVTTDQLAGSRTAVFVGISSWDFAYLGLSYQDRGVIDTYSNTGGSLSIASNRIAYCFDLRGPSASVDTACSSALVSLHLACQSIWNDGCPMALAGGVNALLAPDFFVAFSQLSMLSPDGRCKTFDARANGFVRGEGAGMVLLKPLSQAAADRDRIYAVIRGTAVNQDGRTPGMTVPRQESQESLLRQACRMAGVRPETIQYVEAHGTGTQVGDPIETRALGSVLSANRPQNRPCIVGSVKTNIGHLEAGAGIASLIKVVLSLYHGQIPRNLHFERPNPQIDFEALKLRVPVETEVWPECESRLASINGFGYGGTNAHVILQGAEEHADSETAKRTSRRAVESEEVTSGANKTGTTAPQVVPLSARSAGALKDAAGAMSSFVENSREDITLPEIAALAAHRRSHHEHRLVVTAGSKSHLCEQLALFSQEGSAPDIVSARCNVNTIPKVSFVCSGQGPQWWAMGRELLEANATYRSVIQRCDLVSRELGPWSLLQQLTACESASQMHRTAIAQPAIFALQAALGEMWRSWGVAPDQLVGHSVGEVAAAYLAGVYSLEEAFRVVYHRGRCMDLTSEQGRMLAVGMAQEEAEQLIAPYRGEVTIAAANSPSSMTLSGAAEPLEEIAALLEQRQVFCRKLQVEYAFHSSQMDPARDELLRSLGDLQPAKATTPLMSTVTGDWLDGTEMDAEYWWQNVRKTVRFADAIVRMAQTEPDVVLELSPHPVLAYSVTECHQQLGRPVQVLHSLKREEPELRGMLHSLGRLHTLGYPIDWQTIAPRPTRFIRLPPYAWQRQRCWYESTESRYSRFTPPAHPLLGVPQNRPEPGWQVRLDLDHFAYLADHRVQGMTLFPAAAYAEMALAAVSELHGRQACRIHRLKLRHPCILAPEDPHWLETQYTSDDRMLRISSRLASEDGNWTLHATAECATQDAANPEVRFDLDEARLRCGQHFDRVSCYELFGKMGLQYGPTFQGVVEGWRTNGEAVGIVELPASAEDQQSEYLVHPALLDACFHVAIPADRDYETRRINLYLPVEIGRMVLHRRAKGRVICHARLRSKTATRTITDFDMYDEQGQLLLEVHDLVSQRVNGGQDTESLDDLLYRYIWQSKPGEQPDQESTSSDELAVGDARRWIVLADHTGTGSALCAQLEAQGDEIVMVTAGRQFKHSGTNRYQICPGRRDDMLQLLRHLDCGADAPCWGIVHLWNLDAPQVETLNTDNLETAQEPGVLSALHLVQAWDALVGDQSTRLFLVTRGAQSVGEEPRSVSVAQSPVIGFGRVIVSEYPKFRCRLVDLDPARSADVVTQLAGELGHDDDEDEVALRGAERFVHRFVPVTDMPQTVPAGESNVAYRLETNGGGTLDELALRTFVRRQPESGEVEIAISAAALNFADVMKALGLYPGLPDGPIALGAECSGVVTRIGPDVVDFAPGDEVIAVAPCTFGSHTVVHSQLVAAKPTHLSFEEAATIPIAFLTAAHALEQLARIRAGERVLIHSASGGVGLAAIQLARQAGAEIYATAGTEEKREFLRREGIEHIMDSRSLEFADQVAQRTDGQGVDVILNSLAGEAIPRGIESLAVGGRFLEIGKRDIYQNALLGLLPFRNNLAFFAIDLDQLMRDQPARTGELLRDLAERCAKKQLTPLPHRTFPIGDIKDAFRFMQQGKHIGKIVVTTQPRAQQVEWGSCEPITFDSEATYLITGGLGGFGLALAQWLVDRGARHLVLLGRRGVHTTKARQVIETLEATGATVVVMKADVAKQQDVARVIGKIRDSLPPLRGVFHAAMVLEDGLLLNLDREWMRRVMAPKINGGWNLHTLTRDCPLDHFVLFSSLSSVFGHAGQGNYAAANAFLDALTYLRRSADMPCLTVNWGYLGDVGYLAERQQLGERLERQGVMSFTIAQALEALERALQRQAVQWSVMRVDWSKWRGLGVTGQVSPRFAHLLPQTAFGKGAAADGLPTIEAIQSALPADRPPLVAQLLHDKTARLLGVAPERLDGDTPLLDLGLDSLMAVEMRNWIESQLQVNLPVAQLMRSQGIAQLITVICQRMSDDAAPQGPEQTTPELLPDDPRQLLENIDQLSGDQVDSLLTTLLEEESRER